MTAYDRRVVRSIPVVASTRRGVGLQPVFNLPGQITATTIQSGRYTVVGAMTVLSTVTTLNVADPTNSTTVTMYKNGVSYATYTLAGAATRNTDNTTYNFVDADYITVAVTAANSASTSSDIVVQLIPSI